MPTARFSLGLALILAWCCSAPAGEWIGDPGNGIRVWNPNPVAGETVRWTGPAVDGVASGEGELTWYLNGRVNGIYRGWMRGGIYNGSGRIEWFDAAGRVALRYEGGWLDDQYHGPGVLERFKDGAPLERREGWWIKNRPASEAEWRDFASGGGAGGRVPGKQP